jgi:thiamine biosynthesis protein ThiC
MHQTQVELAVAGITSLEMKALAEAEQIDTETVRKKMTAGQIVLPKNKNSTARIVGIGNGLSTKINASIGTSTDIADINQEIRKARRDLDWTGQFQNALFPDQTRQIRNERSPICDSDVCTMCSDFCTNKASAKIFEQTLNKNHKA